MLIPEHLELHMMRVCHEFLDQQSLITEGILRFSPGGFDCIRQFVFSMNHPHPLPPTPCRGFNQNRISNIPGCLLKFCPALDPLHAWDGRHPRFFHADF